MMSTTYYCTVLKCGNFHTLTSQKKRNLVTITSKVGVRRMSQIEMPERESKNSVAISVAPEEKIVPPKAVETEGASPSSQAFWLIVWMFK